MGRELERLRKQKDEAIHQAEQKLAEREQITEHLTQVRDEYDRVVEMSGQAGYVLDKIDRDFKEKTKLSGGDIVLLFLCTALQCARQYLLSNEMFRLQDIKDEAGKVKLSSSNRGDKLMMVIYGGTLGRVAPPSWQEVLFQSVPYDVITTGAHISGTEIAGATHRYRTLGHDPVLGWIFGTANIMTSSLTKYNLETYQVSNSTIIRHYPLGVVGMLEKAGTYAQKDPLLLGASVARQAIHFGSDMFTKQGLPIPLIMTVNNDLAKNMLSEWHINTWSVMWGAALAALINQLIFFIHQLFYNEDRDGPHSMYEVRTRKILSYSNALATGSNILVVAITKDVSKLDIGGIIVTLHRLVSDYKFIHEIKRDFLQEEFYKMVIGNQYDFMEGKQNVQ